MTQDEPLSQAAASLQQLIDDPRIPESVREELAEEFQQVDAMITKLRRGDLHIAAVGRVSVGKSSLLNALVGEPLFEVGPLHGVTRESAMAHWADREFGGVHLLDTPGINELDGEARERMAVDVASRSDLVIFVVEGDLTTAEAGMLDGLLTNRVPVILALNKADRYTADERETLLGALRGHVEARVRAEDVVAVAADPRPQKILIQREDGSETWSERKRPPELEALEARVWAILEQEGKTLAAMNAALFAGRVSDDVARRIADARRNVADRVVRTYCLAKGVAVGVNPLPVADLLAAAAIDVALVKHLSEVYGLPMTRREGGRLLGTIIAQLALLMGAVWGVHLVSSALKGISAGLSTAMTAGAQGALAYYATYLVGKASEVFLVNGKSWGVDGPKQVVKDILDRVDRQSMLADARSEILRRLKAGAASHE